MKLNRLNSFVPRPIYTKPHLTTSYRCVLLATGFKFYLIGYRFYFEPITGYRFYFEPVTGFRPKLYFALPSESERVFCLNYSEISKQPNILL